MIDYAYHLDLIDLALGELNHISLPLILQDDTHVRCEFTSNYVPAAVAQQPCMLECTVTE